MQTAPLLGVDDIRDRTRTVTGPIAGYHLHAQYVGHYVAVAIGEAHEKGLVENLVGYARRNIWTQRLARYFWGKRS